ncbi:MAG: OmpH family outer membrane protein, partial [Planctomycetota bacterium]
MNARIQAVLTLIALLASPVLADEQAVVVEVQGQAVVVEVQAEAVRVQDKAAPAVKDEKQAVDAEKNAEVKDVEAKDAEGVTQAEDKPAQSQPTEAELRQKMRDLERELQEARSQFQQKADKQRRKVQEDAKKAIQDIMLPKNPTREQCETFVAELRKATQGRRSFSSSDPVTKKLKEIPAEHFDLLIKEMSDRTPLRYYANYAMREIKPEKLRERFVNSLSENPNNIGIIVMHGWTGDVREEIVEFMASADGSITPAWFQAAVEINEPSLYPKLHEIATSSRYASQFITMLEVLPDYDVA